MARMVPFLMIFLGDFLMTIYTLTGFDNWSYFSKRFKQQFGFSPKEFLGQDKETKEK